MKKTMKNPIIIIFLLLTSFAFAADIKEADLAGTWYPSSKDELQALLQGYLDKADPPKVDGKIFAIISPHAGFQFSGPVAAYGFKLVQGRAIKTVIIIGFSHRKFFDGISVYAKGSWRTPLGDLPIDEETASGIISANPRIRFEPALFEGENSVEMQVPFVQMVLKDAKVVPIAFGTQSYSDAEILAGALAKTLKGRDDCLIVASTDLSHYHPYDEAVSIDKRTITTISIMRGRSLYDEASVGISELCGVMPVTATLLAAERLGFNKVETLKDANSGDTYGDKTKVVGYLSAVVYKDSSKPEVQSSKAEEKKNVQKKEETPMLNNTQKKRLLQIARESVASYVKDGKRKTFTEKDPVLNEPMGAFLTLHENGNLRGCIGNMVGQGPLYLTVADMAIEAATGDPRFPGLSPSEIDKIDIEISVLSPLKKVASTDEIKIPGHGVLVRCPSGGGVYLPQVAVESGWNKEEFLTSLCGQKAGIAPDAWKKPGTDLYVFTAEVFGEKK